MTQADPRTVLGVPALFRLFKRMVLTDRGSRLYMEDHVRAREGARVLDIGCGVADVLDTLPAVDYHGFDLSPAYIEAARGRYGDRGHFHCAAVSELSLGGLAGTCDVVMANGILHHLDDADAVRLLRTAAAALKPGGHVVTFDGCYVEGQGRLSRWLVSLDRGEHVRAREDYLRLAREVFPDVTSRTYSDLLRFPYEHIVMEGVKP
ncbi:MAG: class I SAM-dependent methyltransferase [Myxococcales bacterium]|nr:class I SAM-dependent methyltransferase [Myxococcales bacterium]